MNFCREVSLEKVAQVLLAEAPVKFRNTLCTIRSGPNVVGPRAIRCSMSTYLTLGVATDENLLDLYLLMSRLFSEKHKTLWSELYAKAYHIKAVAEMRKSTGSESRKLKWKSTIRVKLHQK